MKGILGSLVILGLICFFGSRQVDARSARVPWWQIKVTKSQGPNACIVEEVPELNKKYWTECKYWPIRKVCGKETLVRYECCEGYQQTSLGEEGCNGVKPLKNVLDTARDLGATKFVKYLEDSGIAPELMRDGTFTLFAPFDSAWEHSASANAVGMKIESFLRNPNNPVLRYHISNSKHPSKEFSGNSEIESQYQGRKLRISKYSTGMEAVNCILISRKDQEATNGIVHMIDHPLDPTLFLPRDLVQILYEDGRFTKMASGMDRCGFTAKLRESGKTYTLLAPSDEAFLKIPPSRLEKMFSDPAACTAMLENHVIPHVMCMPVITEEYKARTIGSSRVDFDCDSEKGHTIDGKKVGGEYILGSNGILYMLDDVIIPDRARTLGELAEQRHLDTFLQLARTAGLEGSVLNGYTDYTVFAPSEAAWYSIDYELLEQARGNADLARKLIMYHIAPGRLVTNGFQNNQLVSSMDEENTLRLLVYRKTFGVEDAVIEKSDVEGANGILHVVSKVMFPATQSAGDVLRKSGNYTMFLQTMESILAEDPEAIDLQRSGSTSNHYTFFVPTDEAFRRVGGPRLRRLQNDRGYMTRVMKNHISSSMMSSDAFKPDLLYDMPTRQNALGIKCDKSKNMKVNDANVVKKDIMSSTGVIHVIDRLILPENDIY